MNRDFEFKQLLRAYRGGIISESAFEAEMAKLEGGAPVSNGDAGGFHAFGKTYKNERAAIVSFLDKVRAGEANGGEAFAAWASVCTTDCIKTGIRMIAEREAYHSRIFEQRLMELGGEKRGHQRRRPEVQGISRQSQHSRYREAASLHQERRRSEGSDQADFGVRRPD